jgi:hypothetical protein
MVLSASDLGLLNRTRPRAKSEERASRPKALIQTDASINPGNSGGQLAVLESPHLAHLAELPLDCEAAEFSERLRRRYGRRFGKGL